jgi:hypothetical protein
VRFALLEASPPFVKSDRMAKRIERIERMRTDFYSACGGKGRAEGESKSVPIRFVRFIRFTIMPLYAAGVKRAAQ